MVTGWLLLSTMRNCTDGALLTVVIPPGICPPWGTCTTLSEPAGRTDATPADTPGPPTPPSEGRWATRPMRNPTRMHAAAEVTTRSLERRAAQIVFRSTEA